MPEKYFIFLPLLAGTIEEEWKQCLCQIIDTRAAAEKAFDMAVDILDKENMSLNNIVRQWNFIGNILAVNDNLQCNRTGDNRSGRY